MGSFLQKTRAAACPHLGLAGDAVNRHEQASDEHRCHAGVEQERVDLDHQRRFCLASSYTGCPFLTATKAQPRPTEQIEAWWRNVSPRRPALTAAQLGHAAELGAAAARDWISGAALLALQTWRIACPVLEAATVFVGEQVETRKPRRTRPTSPPRVTRRRHGSSPAILAAAHRGHRPPQVILAALRAIVDMGRVAVASIAVLLGVAWLLSAAPAAVRDAVLSTSGVPSGWLPDAAGATSLVHMTLAGGYDVGLAIPYTIGFLALFVGLGSLGRQPSPGGRR